MQFINNKIAVPNRSILPVELAVCFFWLLYALKSTVMADLELFKFSGLFYPLYLLMMIAFIKNFSKINKIGGLNLYFLLYCLFLYEVVFSLIINQVLIIDFMTLQSVFIYSLGLLTIFQFSTLSDWIYFRFTTGFTSVFIALWVIYSYFTASTSIVYRGGIDIDQNVVASIICIGAITIASSLSTRVPFWRLILTAFFLILAFYATALLASRGVSISLLIGLTILYLKHLNHFRSLLFFSIFVLIVLVVLPHLPGTEMLSQRFSGGNIQTMNDRTIIWQGCLKAWESGTFFQMLFGFGFRASEDIVASVVSGLTSTHNGYMRIFIEQGVSGLAIFLALHILVFSRLWRKGDTALEGLALLVTLMIANLSLSFTSNFLYWIAFGSVSAMAFLPHFPTHGEAI